MSRPGARTDTRAGPSARSEPGPALGYKAALAAGRP